MRTPARPRQPPASDPSRHPPVRRRWQGAWLADIRPSDARKPESPIPAKARRRGAPSLFYKLGAVIVGGIAINRVDMFQISELRRVFDNHRRPLNAVIR